MMGIPSRTDFGEFFISRNNGHTENPRNERACFEYVCVCMCVCVCVLAGAKYETLALSLKRYWGSMPLHVVGLRSNQSSVIHLSVAKTSRCAHSLHNDLPILPRNDIGGRVPLPPPVV